MLIKIGKGMLFKFINRIYELMVFIYLFIYLHFIYHWQCIKTHDLKVQLKCIAVQIIRYMHAN